MGIQLKRLFMAIDKVKSISM